MRAYRGLETCPSCRPDFVSELKKVGAFGPAKTFAAVFYAKKPPVTVTDTGFFIIYGWASDKCYVSHTLIFIMTVLFFSLKNRVCSFLYENAENKSRTGAFFFPDLELNLEFFSVGKKKSIIMRMRVSAFRLQDSGMGLFYKRATSVHACTCWHYFPQNLPRA